MADPRHFHVLSLKDASRPDQKEVLTYWRSLSHPPSIPHFRDFDLLDLARLASFMLILERPEGSDHIDQFKFIGSDLVRLMAADVTGMRIMDGLPDADHLVFVTERFKQMEWEREPVLWTETLFWQNRDWVKFEILGLPLENNEGLVDRIGLHFSLLGSMSSV